MLCCGATRCETLNEALKRRLPFATPRRPQERKESRKLQTRVHEAKILQKAPQNESGFERAKQMTAPGCRICLPPS